MRGRSRWVQRGATLAAVALLLGGCAALQADRARRTEQLLAAAGFQLRIADTPEKLAHLEKLTQRKLVPHQKDGVVHFVFADASGCRCLYVGNAQAYQRYQALVVQAQIAEDQRFAAEANRDAAMNWTLWGPFAFPPGPF